MTTVRAPESPPSAEAVLDWRTRWLPLGAGPIRIGDVGAQGWNAVRGDLSLPAMVLREADLAHNIAFMAEQCREHGALLAPHGKTTMSPELFERQLAAGAWGITAATPSQVRVYRELGIGNVLLANELIQPAALEWIAGELSRDPDFRFLCLVDSVGAVEQMTNALATQPAAPQVEVLVELGLQGGRTGARSIDDAVAVAEAVRASNALRLVGVEGYEGILPTNDDGSPSPAVDVFLRDLRELATEIDRRDLFEGDEIVVSAGGSTFIDRVFAILGHPWALTRPVRLIVRSGSYVVHDDGLYEDASPYGLREPNPKRRLRAAMRVLGSVLSTPEAGLVIVGVGKRDVPYDFGLPKPLEAYRDGRPIGLSDAAAVKLNDQHAYLRVQPAADLRPGDVVVFGISHPCTAFDRWPAMALVDDDYQVTGAIRTIF